MNKEKNNTNKCPICGRSTHKESKYCIFHASAEEKTEDEFIKALKEYVDKIKKEINNYDFKEFIFVGQIRFADDLSINTFKYANFAKATFDGNVIFVGATFNGSAYFSGTNFKGNANFKWATFNGYANFVKATFDGNANFKWATFNGSAYFSGTNFKGNANFGEAVLNGSTNFKGVLFGGFARFADVTFKGDVNFTWTTIKKDAIFEEATFNGYALFGRVIFNGYAFFIRATFNEYTNFRRATFKKYANFTDATFNRGVDIGEAIFNKDVHFRVEPLIKKMYFCLVNIKVLSGNKLNLKVNNNVQIITLERAYLENTDLDMELVKDTLIDFTDALLKNTKIKKEQIKGHILQEEEKNFLEAKEIYLLLKNNFHSIGQYEDESWAFEKEKEMERKLLSFPYYKNALKEEGTKEKFPILKWIKKGYFKKLVISAFSNIIYGYGERPWNVIFSAGVLIFIFALLFSLIGIGTPEIIELKGTAIHQNYGIIVDLASKGFIKNTPIRNFPDSLYFSLITFTTLGYGDFRPLEGLGRILAGSEAFIGAFMMALFVYTFARRTGGR